MKKLTAGIFATLLAVVSADGAYAAIASSGYVDDKVGEVQTAVTAVEGDVSELQTTVGQHTTQIAAKADSATVTALDGRVKAAEGEIDTLQTEVDGKQDALGFTPENSANKTTTLSGTSTDAQYPSAKAVWDTIQTETTGIASDSDVTALKGRVDTLETASANHVVKNEEITGGTHTKITYDAKGLVTAGANLTADDIPTIPNTKVSGLGSLATKSSVATTDIASKAVTKEKLADDIVTSLGKADNALQQADLNGYLTKTAADAAYADIATETTASTASTNAQTALTNIGTLTNLTTEAKTNTVAAINEVAGEAAAAASAASAADTKAGQAQTAADAAQGEVDALEVRVGTAETDIDGIQGQLENMATSETVEGLQTTVTNLQSTKQDKTDNTLTTGSKTVVGAINEVKAQADKGVSDAATAKSAADAAKDAADAAQRTADAKQDKLTGTIGGSMQPVYLNDGTITAGTALGTLATKSKVTNSEVDDGALAQSKINGLAASLATKLTTPPTSSKGESGLYVLTYDGTDFEWEDIARTVAE